MADPIWPTPPKEWPHSCDACGRPIEWCYAGWRHAHPFGLPGGPHVAVLADAPADPPSVAVEPPADAQNPPADPTLGRIDRDIQAAVDEMRPHSLAQRVAIENTLQDRRNHGRPLDLEPAVGAHEPALEPPADWSWQDDPDVVSWDWRQGPDLDELAEVLARHGVTLTELDTGSDDVAVRVGSTPVEVMEDALCRRMWAAALRYAGDHERERQFPLNCVALGKLADRIEAGALTPWAETPPADPPSVAVCGQTTGPLLASGRIYHCELPQDHPPPHREGQTIWQPMEPTERNSLVDHEANHREPVSDCEWCPLAPDPPSPPATSTAPAPAAPGTHQDTPEAHSGAEGLILGRATVAWEAGRPVVTSTNAPRWEGARMVLLVPVEAGPVLEAALWWRRDVADARLSWPSAVALAAAVDAATSRQPTPQRNLAPAADAPTEPAPDLVPRTGGIVRGAPIRLDNDCVLPGVLGPKPAGERPSGYTNADIWGPEPAPEAAPERCTALTRHTDINGDDMVPCDNPLPCSWHLAPAPSCTEPDAATEAEMDAGIAEFAALPECQPCGGTGKQVPDGWHERRREAERHAAEVLAPAVERLTRFEASRPWNRAAEAAPEPAGDGPGWDRDAVEAMIWHGERGNVRMGGWHVRQIADQLRPLLADRDHLAEVVARVRQLADNQQSWIDGGRVEQAISREAVRDTLRRILAGLDTHVMSAVERELAEVTAERDQLRLDLTVAQAALAQVAVPTDEAHEAQHQRMDERFRQDGDS